jgi:hypothetical protein
MKDWTGHPSHTQFPPGTVAIAKRDGRDARRADVCSTPRPSTRCAAPRRSDTRVRFPRSRDVRALRRASVEPSSPDARRTVTKLAPAQKANLSASSTNEGNPRRTRKKIRARASSRVANVAPAIPCDRIPMLFATEVMPCPEGVLACWSNERGLVWGTDLTSVSPGSLGRRRSAQGAAFKDVRRPVAGG